LKQSKNFAKHSRKPKADSKQRKTGQLSQANKCMLDNDKVAKVLLGDSAIYNFTAHF
jgi:hypothetical protein